MVLSAAPALTGRDACFDSRGGWEFQNPPARLIFRERPGKGTGLAGALCELFKLNTQAAGALCCAAGQSSQAILPARHRVYWPAAWLFGRGRLAQK